ncbi:unnamed protein product [Cuscuta europaea]|uniref:UvrD-like helicase ATP-binding domain-containing protein n=1 Tax=Cuscuta europaea TaxID=41803 RepID=A0A9P0ZJQ1_CUSEU|nr:unnamed protein product [Cuscuta europaea]
MEEPSSVKREVWPKNDLIDIVFSWSLEDIFDDTLYRNQVEKIPDTFRSWDHYLCCYTFPLLEETRATVASSLEVMDKAPFAQVISFDLSKGHGKSIYYKIKVESWKRRINDEGEHYKTLPGDLVVISDSKPETLSDLNRVGWNWTFSSVVNVTDGEDDDGNSSTYFKVKMPIDFGDVIGDHATIHIVFLANFTTSKRIWSALGMTRNLNIISTVLHASAEGHNECHICSPHADVTSSSSSSSAKSIEDSLLAKLNESQANAVLTCLERMKCHHISHVDLIWGPPGTGKTSTVSILLFMLLKKQCRTLICAPTNVAITQVASRVLRLAQECYQDESSEKNLLYPLGDVVLFGNKDRLKLGEYIEEIYLDYRVKRLHECFGSLTGWRHCICTAISFLEDSVSDHEVFEENKLIKKKELIENGQTLDESVEPISFAEFLKLRFDGAVLSLRSCMVTMCTHIPRHFIQEYNFQAINSLICHLDSLKEVLFQKQMPSDEDLKDFFSQPLTSEVFSDMSSLVWLRIQCISILKTLLVSLGKLEFPSSLNGVSIMDFCLKLPSLVFCTSSSSFKLHSVEMEPFKLLVIDEAAQLRECESIIPLQLPGIIHAILVGDECQLPAIVHSNVSNEACFGRSLFERLSSLDHPKLMLDVQYRMHPAISRFPNSCFYQNQLRDAPNVQTKAYGRRFLLGRMFGPYSFISLPNGKEELDDVGQSKRNMVEVAIVIKIVHNLFKFWRDTGNEISIGVVSPYAAQVVALKDKIGRRYDNLDGFAVKVKSIDGFQGGEEDIIILSTVRSNRAGTVGFMSSLQRTNVALTRARHCLWILGNERTLMDSNSVWKELVQDARKRQRLFSASDDCDLSKTILNVKKELDQLDDLLNADSFLFKNQRWNVLLSDNFKKSYKNLASSHLKKAVLNLLLKLSGGWRPKRKSVDLMCQSSSQIVKQFKVEGQYIVCTVDIQRELKYTQILRAWDLLPLDEVGKLLRRLDSIFAMYTDNFINMCKEKCLDGDLEVPKVWPVSIDLVRFKNLSERLADSSNERVAGDGRSYIENSRVSESLLLMKFYSLSSGIVNHLLSDNRGEEIDIPFEVTDEEKEIIKSRSSSFILGRSGTGKTTVLTMKLFQKEQQHHLSLGVKKVESNNEINKHEEDSVAKAEKTMMSQSEDKDKMTTTLRQLFVTVSPKLCYAVKQQVAHLKCFAQGGKFSDENSLLDMLDDLDGLSHFKDIPDSFVSIPERKYPLVITFRKFLMMLDGTLRSSYFDRFQDKHTPFLDAETLLRRKEVNFDRFCCLYWPHLNSQFTKNHDAAKVFTEIISHIKGGLRVGEAHNVKLGRSEYVSMSLNRVSTLNEKSREEIYNIFLDYEKMKMERREFDLADLVNDLHFRLNEEIWEGDKMDFVYIDEVQDLTMRQISLFKYICQNVDEGFVFSGDTAQTIARGIDFRFEDVRTLFYEEFVLKLKGDLHATRKDKGHIARVSCLLQNFRTHAGVLRLAQSVIDILAHYFPLSIDALAPETSLIYGEAPILLRQGSNENAIVTIFGNSGGVSGKMVGFGAEQVILVRDEFAKQEVSGLVGKQALILTIVECKGLEFQDVLLYNFFGTSPLRNQWRVVYEFMKLRKLLDQGFSQSFPCFTEARHTILCSELKQLYVAVTRTRQRLWICERVEEFSKPMFDYWKKMGLVEVRDVDESLAKAMRLASTPEQWKSRGLKLLWEKNYEMAIMCFERAGERNLEKQAKASSLRETADRVRDLNPNASISNLREAAEIFESIGKFKSAAECFCDLKEYERAGAIYLKKCGEQEQKKAAECFTLAGCYETAAEIYAKQNCFSECLSVCSKGHLYDVGFQYVEHWKQHAFHYNDKDVHRREIERIEQEFLERCASDYSECNDRKSMMKFVKAFKSMDDMRHFLKNLNCLDELLLLEEESGNFVEAAELAKLKGDVLQEADLLGKAGNFSKASSRVLWYVLVNSLWVRGCKPWPIKSFESKNDLLKKAISFARDGSDIFYESVCTEAKVFEHEESNLCELRRALSASQKCGSLRGEILCLRKIMDAHTQVRASTYSWEDESPVDLKFGDDTMFCNQLSLKSLCHFWNLWKKNVFNILESITVLESTQDFGRYKGFGEFCLNYFGVRRLFSTDMKTSYVMIIPDAEWATKLDRSLMRQNQIVPSIDEGQFIDAARNHWKIELYTVGVRVLEMLESLYIVSMGSFSEFRQSMCLISIYQISKFILESKELNCKNYEGNIMKFFQFSMSYFEHVFPIHFQKPMEENMIALRGTEVSRSLLEEFIIDDIGRKGELTLGQIGRLMIIWFGSAKPADELCKKILERIKKGSSWIHFIEILRGPEEPLVYSINGPKKPEGEIHRFHDALEETYSAHWCNMRHTIQPHCFLYLVERFLMTFQLNGFFYSTKSSFLEWLRVQEPGRSLVASFPPQSLSSEMFYKSILFMVEELLVKNIETGLWIERSGIKSNGCEYNRLLVLRLVLILCSLCMNSATMEPINVLHRVLQTPFITSDLPRDFTRVFRQATVGKVKIAEALKAIGNPICLVCWNGQTPSFVCRNTITIRLGGSYNSKEDIIRMLFPRKNFVSYGQEEEVNVKKNSCCLLPLSVYHGMKSSMVEKSSSDNKASTQRQDLNGEENQRTLQMKWSVLDEDSASLEFKEELDECINFMTAVANYLSEKKATPSGEESNIYDDVKSLLTELQQLSETLDKIGMDEEEKQESIAEVKNRLLLRKPGVEVFLNSVIVVKDSSEVMILDSVGDKSPVDENATEEVEEDEEEDEHNNMTGLDNCKKNQGMQQQGKSKNKARKRKGKGGRGRK